MSIFEIGYTVYIRRRYAWFQLDGGAAPHKLGSLSGGKLSFWCSKLSQILDSEDVSSIEAAFESRGSPEDYITVGSFRVVAVPDKECDTIHIHLFSEEGERIGSWTPRKGLVFCQNAHTAFKKDRATLNKWCTTAYLGTEDNIFD